MSVELSSSRTLLRTVPLPAVLLAVRCAGFETGSAPLTADVPLHLEEHIDAAVIDGSEVPVNVRAPVSWSFHEPQPTWKSTAWNPANRPLRIEHTGDALRVFLTAADRRIPEDPRLGGAIYVDLADWDRHDWGQVIVQVRTSDDFEMRLGFNRRENLGTEPWEQRPFIFVGEEAELIADGSIQTYRLDADWSWGFWEGPWQQLGFMVAAAEPATLDILSVRVVPKEADYAGAPVGVRMVARESSPSKKWDAHRRALYAHTPGRIEYRILVPEAGRLDLGLGVLRDEVPVSFRVRAVPPGGEPELLLEESYADKTSWGQRSVDLSHLKGQSIRLSLEADADPSGSVALWAAPTLSGARTSEKPNIIFYIIDGAGADYMSVYGYNRRTTPNLERLAAEGAVFERAYSNSTWTKPSTPSFMTSLQHSVLGGYRRDTDQIPEQAVTMAQHLHRAGYQTGVFVSNPYAASSSGLARGVDALREGGVENNQQPSQQLHEDFWRWRQAYPGEPYWAHFQTTDVHTPWRAAAPFAGLFHQPRVRENYDEWKRRLTSAAGNAHLPWQIPEAFEKTGISYEAFFNAGRSLYDETMAQNDYHIGRLVERLKGRSEWEHTLFIVAADHGSGAAHLPEPFPPSWGPMFRSSQTRIPLIVVWPERIAGGQRFSEPVSMIDVLPTTLDLVGLPMPEVIQGQSLAPLLLGQEGWEPRPVILDEFNVDRETGQLSGFIEVIDRRWGASLRIDPSPDDPVDAAPDLLKGRPVALLLYDLWNDPFALHSLHEERPDLVKKYNEFLEAQFEAHQALAEHFTRSEDSPLTPEQLRTLRSLGYIQ
jgi:arylsulfatase A-like enzyme